MTDEKRSFDEVAREFVNAVQDFAEVERGSLNDADHLLISWGLEGRGFGQLSFCMRDGVLHLDNETMSRKTCKRILDGLVDALQPADELPPLFRRYQSVDALLDACVPHWPGRDWERQP